MSAANIHQTEVPSELVVYLQHTHPTTTPPLSNTTNQTTSSPCSKLTYVTMSSTSNLPPTYIHVLLRDCLVYAHAADQYNPRSRHAGHPLAPFLNVPQPPAAEHDLGTALETSPGWGLQAPLVLAAPRSTTDLRRAVDLSARIVDSYLLTSQYSTSPPHLACFKIHGASFRNRLVSRTRCSRLAHLPDAGFSKALTGSMISPLVLEI
jgi:hypothetical protein